MHRRTLVICLISMLAVTAIGMPALAQSTETASPESDNTIIHVYVHENGTAEWVFQTRTRLDTTDDAESFNAFKQEYNNNSTAQLNDFRDRMTRLAADANETTGRQMSVRDFETSAFVQEVPRQWGVVEYRFFWDGFATQTDAGLGIGDVFEGGWLLSETDTLVVHAPDGYTATSIDPQPDTNDDGTKLIWKGAITFSDERPEVVFTQDETTAPTPPENDSGLSMGVIFGGLGLLIAIILGTAVYRRRREKSSGSEKPTEQTTTPPMTDGERVLDMLHKNGGRMKQADINEGFDWSKSKTSLVITDLAEDDKVTKVRLGRENLVELVGEDGD